MELDEQKNRFSKLMRNEYIERLKAQIELEGESRYYRFIITLADYYRNDKVGDVKRILDEEKKIIEKENDKIEKDKKAFSERKESICERKFFIPMLELELCILTTRPLPPSLFFPRILQDSKPSPKEISDLNLDFFFEKEFHLKEEPNFITHAHVTLAYLSYSPSKWNEFLEKFKKYYNDRPNTRFSFLFFLSIWFEMRPRHFLTKIPILFDFVEDFNDGYLFAKHLKIILKQAKWNTRFMFLPIDAISPFFHLTYLQLSDKNKVIVGVDASSIQNSFKSNMMKKFDLKKKMSPQNPKLEINITKTNDNDNSNEATIDDSNNKNTDNKSANNSNQNKNSNNRNPNANNNKKPNNTNNNPGNKNSNNANKTSLIIKKPNNTNNNPGNKNSNNTNNNDSNNNDDGVDYGNELYKAFAVCMLAIQNSLSFDCFLDFSENENEDEYYKKCVERMNTTELEKTSNLKYFFELDEFYFWKQKSLKIKMDKEEILKLVTIAHGFSDWIVGSFNDKNINADEKNIIFENLVKIYEGVGKICKDANNLMKINTSLIEDKSVQNKFQDKKELIQTETNMNNNYEIFFTEKQKNYKQVCTNFDKNNYQSLTLKVFDIICLLNLKTNLSSPEFKKGFDPKLPSNIEVNCEDCFSVDPHMIRIAFYHVTQSLFKKGEKEKFNFDV